LERTHAKCRAERHRERGRDSLLRYHQGSHPGRRLSSRRDTVSLDCRDSCRILHYPGGKPRGRYQDALHEQPSRRVQGRDRLRHQDLRPGRLVRVLQGLRAEFLSLGILEHRIMGDLRADEIADEEAT